MAWAAIQNLEPAVAAETATVASVKDRGGKKATPTNGAPAASDGSKKAPVLAMLQRPAGVTLTEIIEATGWQDHSVRGFLSR